MFFCDMKIVQSQVELVPGERYIKVWCARRLLSIGVFTVNSVAYKEYWGGWYVSADCSKFLTAGDTVSLDGCGLGLGLSCKDRVFTYSYGIESVLESMVKKNDVVSYLLLTNQDFVFKKDI